MQNAHNHPAGDTLVAELVTEPVVEAFVVDENFDDAEKRSYSMTLFRRTLSRLTWFLLMATVGALMSLWMGMASTTYAFIIPMSIMFLVTLVAGLYTNAYRSPNAKYYLGLSAFFCGTTLGPLLFVVAWMNYASLILFVALFVPLALFSMMSLVAILMAPKDERDRSRNEIFLHMGLLVLLVVFAVLWGAQIVNAFMYSPQLHGFNIYLSLFLFTALLFIDIFRIFNIRWGEEEPSEEVYESLSNIMAFNIFMDLVNICSDILQLAAMKDGKRDKSANFGRGFASLLMLALGIFVVPYVLYRMFCTRNRGAAYSYAAESAGGAGGGGGSAQPPGITADRRLLGAFTTATSVGGGRYANPHTGEKVEIGAPQSQDPHNQSQTPLIAEPVLNENSRLSKENSGGGVAAAATGVWWDDLEEELPGSEDGPDVEWVEGSAEGGVVPGNSDAAFV